MADRDELLRRISEAGNAPGVIPGVTGVPVSELWDAFACATVPGLPGDEGNFAVRADGTIVVMGGVDPQTVAPLARAISGEIDPPFVVVAVRDEGDDWAAAANRAEIVELPGAQGDDLEVTSMGGEITVRVDGEDSDARQPALEELLERQGGDGSAIAHRFTGTTWVVELFSL